MTTCACILLDEGQVLEDQHLGARDDTAIATWGVSRWPERKLMEWSLNYCNTSDLDFFECKTYGTKAFTQAMLMHRQLHGTREMELSLVLGSYPARGLAMKWLSMLGQRLRSIHPH